MSATQRPHVGPKQPADDLTHVMYLAVLPAYRSECLGILRSRLPQVKMFCSDAHLDETVRTGIDKSWFEPVTMHRLGGRAYLQTGRWRDAMRSKNLIVDLNPRAINVWAMLILRRLLRRRTLVWGHIHPQAGSGASTSGIRRTLRILADGVIAYTYRDALSASAEDPRKAVWVAPNSLYPRASIKPSNTRDRTDLIYVGRFEPAKQVDLLIRGFGRSTVRCEGARLLLVGDGTERQRLEQLVEELGLREDVRFVGWVADRASLATLYAGAFASASPGFAGLGLTQSLGFGVPMIVSKDEPHSPEIELAEVGGVTWAESGSSESWALAIERAWSDRRSVPLVAISENVASRYSAEAMASGLEMAFKGVH